jgi:hypothetical protein
VTFGRCSQKACPFPAESRDGFCGRHRAIFANDDSAESLLAEVQPLRGSGKHNGISIDHPEIETGILNRELSTRKGSLVSFEEYQENRHFKATLRSVYSRRFYGRCKAARICPQCGLQTDGRKVFCSRCLTTYAKNHATETARRRRLGLCTNCGKKIAIPKWRMCEACRSRKATYEKRRRGAGYRRVRSQQSREREGLLRQQKRNAWRFGGLCVNCGERARPEKALCESCVLRNNRRRTRLCSSGRCPQCRLERDGKNILCSECRTKNTARSNVLIASGLCRRCRQARGDSTSRISCRSCLQRDREQRATRKSASLCSKCGGLRDGRTLSCSKCLDAGTRGKARKIKLGLCRTCGLKRGKNGTKSRCARCAEKERNRYSLRRAAGVCGYCGKEKDDVHKAYCSRCRSIVNQRKSDSDKCRMCSGRLDRDGTYCSACCIKRRTRNAVRTTTTSRYQRWRIGENI